MHAKALFLIDFEISDNFLLTSKQAILVFFLVSLRSLWYSSLTTYFRFSRNLAFSVPLILVLFWFVSNFPLLGWPFNWNSNYSIYSFVWLKKFCDNTLCNHFIEKWYFSQLRISFVYRYIMICEFSSLRCTWYLSILSVY